MNKILLLSILSLFSIIDVYAYDFAEVNDDGVIIYYNSSGNNATVTYQSTSDRGYSGNVVIPSQVIHETVTYSVTSIGDDAFRSCSGLTSITISNSVTSVGNYAFSDCSGLTNVVLEDGTTPLSFYYYADQTFANCPIESLYLGRDIPSSYYSPFSNKTTLKSLIIGNSVSSIGQHAFSGCNNLTEILTIPNSVTTIGNGAFSGCSRLTNVVLEDGTTPLSFETTSFDSDRAFADCPIESLYLGRDISYSDNYSSPFRDKTSLKSLTIGNFVTSIGDYIFSGCSGLAGTLMIPNSVISIGYSAFSMCIGLTGTLTIPNSVTSIEGGAFCDCTGLTSITIPNSITALGSRVFYNCSGLSSVSIPNSVTSVGYWAFYGCIGLTSLTIPNSITSIGMEAFRNCSGLTSITIPNSVTLIENNAFSDCNSLKNVVLEDGTTELSWAFDFSNSPIDSLYLGRNIAYDSFSPFDTNTSLKSITIGNSVTYIGNGAFRGCSGLTGTLTIPNSVTSIGGAAFSGCNSLTSILIPNSITSIRVYTFDSCSGLTSLTIPNSVISIEEGAFYRCNGLTALTIPNSVTSIGNYAFYDCDGLTGALTIPNSATYIGDYAFWNCSGLTGTLTISNSATYIGDYAFWNCSGLTGTLIIPNSVITIGKSTFSDCKGLTNIILEDGITTLSFETDSHYLAQAFANCTIDSLYLGRNISFYFFSPFRDKITLKSLIIGNSVTSIEVNAFYGCSGLTSLTIPESVTSIGDNAFYDCSKLMEINCKNPTPPQVQSNTFTGVDKETCALYVPAGCASIYASQPVWKDFFNIQEPTSIHTIVSDSDISVSITSEGIKITGCNPTDRVSIYAVNGQLVYGSVIGNGLISCSLQEGIYIIHTPKKSLKISY